MRSLYEEYRERIPPVGMEVVVQVAHVILVMLIQAGPGTGKGSRPPSARPPLELMGRLLHRLLQERLWHRVFGSLHRAVQYRPARTPVENAEQSGGQFLVDSSG